MSRTHSHVCLDVCACLAQSELSFLAQEAVALDRLAPETWIVVGNCFSLQKEHDLALQFLKRVSAAPFLGTIPSASFGFLQPVTPVRC